MANVAPVTIRMRFTRARAACATAHIYQTLNGNRISNYMCITARARKSERSSSGILVVARLYSMSAFCRKCDCVAAGRGGYVSPKMCKLISTGDNRRESPGKPLLSPANLTDRLLAFCNGKNIPIRVSDAHS